MGAKVICYIQAFDCERTIEAAMQSVLDQTYENWLCFVLSNGNRNTAAAPNATFDVIKNFAAKDNRFVVMNKKVNVVGMTGYAMSGLASRFPGSYLCALDADDEYERDFFHRGVTLAETHHLDIVACGTEIIQKEQAGEREGTLIKRRQIEEDLVIPKDQFTSRFMTYKPFFNETWGKLYRAELFPSDKTEERALREMVGGRFAADLLLALFLLSKSRAMGVLSGTSHKYFQYLRRPGTNASIMANATLAKEQSRRPGKMRYSIYSTHEIVMDFLRKHGEVDQALYEYTQAVLAGWLESYFTHALLPVQDEAAVAVLAAQLVFHPKFDGLMRYQGSGRYDNLRNYQQRMEFCWRLRYMLIAQHSVYNRKWLWKEGLRCSPATRKKLDRIIKKLEETIQMLSGLQEGEPA